MPNRLLTLREAAEGLDKIAREACARHGVDYQRFLRAVLEATSGWQKPRPRKKRKPATTIRAT